MIGGGERISHSQPTEREHTEVLPNFSEHNSSTESPVQKQNTAGDYSVVERVAPQSPPSEPIELPRVEEPVAQFSSEDAEKPLESGNWAAFEDRFGQLAMNNSQEKTS